MIAIIAEEVMQRAEKEGIDAVEVFVQRKHLKKIDIVNKEIKQVMAQERFGFGIRAIVNNQLSFVSSNSVERINEVVELAKQTAIVSNQTVKRPFVNKRFITAVQTIRDPQIIDLTLEMTCDRIANILYPMEEIPKIVNLEGTVILEVEERLISNSEGIWKREVGTRLKASIFTTIKENEVISTGSANLVSRTLDENWRKFFQDSLLNASSLANRTQLSSGRPRGVILAPRAAAKIMAYALIPSFFNKGTNLSLKAFKNFHFNKNLQIIDDPTFPGGQNTFGWDDEGYPSKPRVLVSGGRCRRLLGMNFSCGEGDGQSSFLGNCYRVNFMNIDTRSYVYPPTISSSNLIIQAKKSPQKDLLSDLSSGIYISDVAGAQDANFSTGDFIVTVTEGYEIKNGEITHPVFPFYLSGNIYSILEDPTLLLGSEHKEVAITLTPFNLILPDLLTTRVTISV